MYVPVDAGETIPFRIIKNTLNQELLFVIANHKMIVVATDASYTMPFITNVLMIGPGQIINVLISVDQTSRRYYMVARAYIPTHNTTLVRNLVVFYNYRNKL